MRDRLMRWRWAIAALAMLTLGLAYAFWPVAVPVDTAPVTRGPMAVGITDDGVTRAEDLYVVAAPVSGYLARIELEPGDRVRRGQLITRMTGRPATPLDARTRQELRGARDAAQAAAAAARASLAQARRDSARAEDLARSGFLPRARLEEARTRVATGAAALRQALAETARIDALLAQPQGPGAGASVPVHAPADGAVLSVLRESEGVLPEGTELMTIGDAGTIEVVVDLLSREAARVRPGDRVAITQWGGDVPLAARVVRVEPFGRLKISALGIEEQRVNVVIAFDPAARPQAARLGHGYQIDATIILWEAGDALRVPIGALFRGGDGGWRVLVVTAGRARERALTIGRLNDEFGQVLAGLAAGDEVIVNPGNALRDGARVQAR
jgi:HlyD family secretion protein